jgi:ferredoxin--NADP+ reductase
VQALVADFNAGKLTDPVAKPSALANLVRTRQPDVVDSAGWRAIDAAEVARGSEEGRPRNKFTDVAAMLAAAATAEQARAGGPRVLGLLARLRDRA